MSRRSFVKAGILGTTGLTLAELLRSESIAQATPQVQGPTRRHSVIILWMRGGPSHIDMWDPKPDAPEEVRGEFGTIDTSVPGIQLTDMLTKTAQIMHKWSIVRSLHHHDAGHSTGDQICFTGYNAGPNPDENVASELRRDRRRAAWPSPERPAGLRNDSADGARHGLGLFGSVVQAV